MGFHDTVTTGPICSTSNGELRVMWESTSSPGTTFQVYVDRVLAWSGKQNFARLTPRPAPLSVGSYIDVVAVDPGDEWTDFSASLTPTLPDRKVELNWSAGRWSSMTIASFNVYMSPSPGAAINYATPVAALPWSRGPVPQDGYGIGGYGGGTYGHAEVRYRWTSPALLSGVWQFAVVPLDASGITGTPQTISQTIVSPPLPPSNLILTVNLSTRVPTLNWTAQ